MCDVWVLRWLAFRVCEKQLPVVVLTVLRRDGGRCCDWDALRLSWRCWDCHLVCAICGREAAGGITSSRGIESVSDG